MKLNKPKYIPTLDEAKAYIYLIDFSNIINKMVNHQGWSRDDAEEACKMYRNFLFINKKYGDNTSLPPSEDIDEFWHNHILDTKQYQKDCQAIFGKYFEHYPYLGIDMNTDYHDLARFFETTQALYLKEFGSPINKIRVSGLLGKVIKFLRALELLIGNSKHYLNPASIFGRS